MVLLDEAGFFYGRNGFFQNKLIPDLAKDLSAEDKTILTTINYNYGAIFRKDPSFFVVEFNKNDLREMNTNYLFTSDKALPDELRSLISNL